MSVKTASDLSIQIQSEIDSIQAEIDAYDERIALRSVDDHETTTERAQEALSRPERFKGEHAVATAWLQNHAETIWTRK